MEKQDKTRLIKVGDDIHHGLKIAAAKRRVTMRQLAEQILKDAIKAARSAA